MIKRWRKIAWLARHGRQDVSSLLGLTMRNLELFRLGLISTLQEEQAPDVESSDA